MNKKTISKQFSSDLEKIIKGQPIDKLSSTDKNYSENISIACRCLNALPGSAAAQKEHIKYHVLKQAEKKQSLGNQIYELFCLDFHMTKRKSAATVFALGLCTLLFFPPATTFAESTLHFFNKVIVTYQLNPFFTVLQVEPVDIRPEELTNYKPPFDMWFYKMKIANFGGNILPSEGSEIQIFKSIDDGKKAVNFSLKLPSYLPEGSVLREMAIAPSNQVFLIYDSPSGEIDIVQSVGSDGRSSMITTDGSTEKMLLNGNDAVWCGDATNMIVWGDKNYSFALGGDILKDEIIKIAESLE